MLKNLLLTALLFTSFSVYAQEDESQDFGTPNPIELQPQWWKYYSGDPQRLEERVEKSLSEIQSLVKSVEQSEEKEEAERYLKEIRAHLNTLVKLKSQTVEPTFIAWVPRQQYTLDDYFRTADKVIELEKNQEALNLEAQKLNAFTNEIRQDLSNEFSLYMQMGGLTKEKFLKGLEIIAMRTRLLYLEEEKRLIEEKGENNRLLLTRYRKELGQIPSKLEIAIDRAKIDAALEKLKQKSDRVHQTLVELEAGAEGRGQYLNQKLIHAMIEKSVVEAERAFLQAKDALYMVREKIGGAGGEVSKVRDFYRAEIDQLEKWEAATAAEFEQISASLIADNGAEDEEKYRERMHLTLSSKMLLNELAKELAHVELLLGLIDLYAVKEESFFDKMYYQASALIERIGDFFEGWFYFALFEIGGIPVNLMGIVKAALILAGAILLSKFIRSGIFYFARKRRISDEGSYVIGRIVQYTIIFLGILAALASVGFTSGNLAIILGALGIGIGFGLQNLVNNFICGLTILFARNVRIGDLVELESGHFGRITEVSVQNTTVHTFDGIDVIVPNSSIVGNKVINWTKKDPYQRLHVPFCTAYGTDQDKVSEVVCAAAREIPCTLTKENGVNDPEIWLVEFGDSSLNFELIVWVNIYKFSGRSSMKAAYLSAIEKAFKKSGITIPFPQRDLHLKNIPSEMMP